MTKQERDEKLMELLRWLVEKIGEGYCELDTADLQDKLEHLGFIELRPVDPAENEWDADELYFLKDEFKRNEPCT